MFQNIIILKCIYHYYLLFIIIILKYNNFKGYFKYSSININCSIMFLVGCNIENAEFLTIYVSLNTKYEDSQFWNDENKKGLLYLENLYNGRLFNWIWNIL